MTPSTVYRKAAARIESGKSLTACSALWGVKDEYIINFANYFKDSGSGLFWWGNYSVEKNQLARSLALLFMAEIAEDENGS